MPAERDRARAEARGLREAADRALEAIASESGGHGLCDRDALAEAYQRGVEDTLARLTSDEVQQAAAVVLHFVDSDPPEYPCQVCPPRARVVLAAAAAALSAREETER